MRRYLAHIVVLLTLCIGFQPVAQAFAARCASAGEPAVEMMAMADCGAHADHQMETAKLSDAHVMGNADCCQSGSCTMPACATAAAAVASVAFPRPLTRPDTYLSPLRAPSTLSGHGQDLIRPPLKS